MTDPRPPASKPPATPRWVKVSAIVAVVVVVLVVFVALAGGDHGPSRHLPGSDNPGGGHTPPVQHSP
ncbi:MAG: hypothetical protein M3214_09175 [Actinomycetota bacterium]|nr:hypothetical protein [Actinomycetota bacterium]